MISLVHSVEDSLGYLGGTHKRRLQKGDGNVSDDSSNVPEEPCPSTDYAPETRSENDAVVTDILSKLETLILNDDEDDDAAAAAPQPKTSDAGCVQSKVKSSGRQKKSLPHLDDLSRAVITSYSLQSYIKLLSRQHGSDVAAKIYRSVSQFLCKFFRFKNASLYCHDDFYSGIGVVFKNARKFLCATTNAHCQANKKAMCEGRGCVYLSPGLPYADLLEYLNNEHGSCSVQWLPSMVTPFVNVDTRLDVAAFEKVIEQDVNQNGVVPVLVVAVVGSFLFGHNDLASKLLELRERYGFWLHLVGLNLAALSAGEPQAHLLSVLQSANSFSVPFGSWIGVQGLPYLTFCKSKQPAETDANKSQQQQQVVQQKADMHRRNSGSSTSLDHVTFNQYLDTLPWWVSINELGFDGMRIRVDEAYNISKVALKFLAKYNQIEILGLGSSAADVLSRIEKKSIMPPLVLTFKYKPVGLKLVDSVLDQEYVDCLNIWLGQGLVHESPFLNLQLVDLSPDKLGTAMRYCPLESASFCKCSAEKMAKFDKRLESMINILDVTVHSKFKLPELLSGRPELMAARVPKWAGVTGIVYVPSMMRHNGGSNDLDAGQDEMSEGGQSKMSTTSDSSSLSGDSLTDKQREQISHLNIELLRVLRATDSAFSLGECDNGLKCIKFGMLADERDLVELLNLVSAKGKEIEQSSQYLESLAEIVKQGIEAANEDLRRENESKLINEGLLRQVPLVGSMINWWSPLPKHQVDVKGRAFDLVTGRILMTDAVFKHKSTKEGSPSSDENSNCCDPVNENVKEGREAAFHEEHADRDVSFDSQDDENSVVVNGHVNLSSKN